MLFARPRLVCIGEDCGLGLKYGTRNGLNTSVKIPRKIIIIIIIIIIISFAQGMEKARVK